MPTTEPNEENAASAHWARYQFHVVKELERLNDVIGSASREIGELRVQVAMLQVKSGLWGAVAGVITVLAAVLLSWWGRK